MAATGPADQAQTENMLEGTLKSLFALSEAYPDLKANVNFLELQEELTSTESRIAFARQQFRVRHSVALGRAVRRRAGSGQALSHECR